MATSFGNLFRKRRLRAGAIATALVAGALASLTPAYANHPEVSLSGSNFEIDTDANLKVDDAAPSIDWANVSGTVKPDAPTGATDDSFGQGTKEDTAVPSIVDGSIPPNKSDLLNFGVYLEEDGSGRFLHVFWHRVQEPQGTTNMDFEFNQSETVSANGVTPVRTSGDVLIQYDLAQGGTNPQLFVSRWIDGSEDPPATAADCEASNKLPCWSARENLTAAGDATGSINTSAIPAAEADPLADDISPRTFGEASIDFDALIGESTDCVGFGSAYLKSRASDSFTAALKDFIAPEDVNIDNCGDVKVIKTDDATPANLLNGATFDLVEDAAPIGGAPGVEDTVVAASCTTGPPDNLDGECLFEDVFQGEYWVIETAAPAGHDLANPVYQHVTVTASDTDPVTVTFVNPRQKGAIVIDKTAKHAAAEEGVMAHEGVTFTVKDSDGNVVPGGTVVTDANGTACVGDLQFGAYTVTETVPAGYAAEGDVTKAVTVDSQAACGPPTTGAPESVSFVNVPLTDLDVSVDSQIPGGTHSTIDCKLGTTSLGTAPGAGEPLDDVALGLDDLEPGTYVCTVVIDP
jgi:hypothetical protein